VGGTDHKASPLPCYIVPLRPKYLPQHPTIERPKPVFLPEFKTPRNTPTEMRQNYRGDDKSLARPTSRCILFDDENISFDASFCIYEQYYYSSNYDYKQDI
jgi:hypothetical protein